MLANLKAALAVRNLRQVDLAIHKLGIPPSALSEIIHGRRRASAALRRKIAESLKADERWLFEPAVKIPKGGAGKTSVSNDDRERESHTA